MSAPIVVSPLSDLPEVGERYRPSAMITMMSNDDPVPRPSSVVEERHLHLVFNDIGEPRDGLVPPNTAHIDALIAAVRAWTGEAPLLLHCWFGVSRSTAAAVIALATLRPNRSEADIARALRAAAPFATPNPLMIVLADRQLGRDGRLSEAVAAIGRGAETSEGTPFTLPVDVP